MAMRTDDDALPQLLDVEGGDWLWEREFLGKDGWNTDLVGFDIDVW